MNDRMTRRAGDGRLQPPCWPAACWPGRSMRAQPAGFRLAVFNADVTPRLGHPLLGGHFAPARSVDDPAFGQRAGAARTAKADRAGGGRLVRDSQRRLSLAGARSWPQAAGTSPERVLVTSVHQHDAPLADLTAERLLAEAGVDGHIIDPDFHERTVAARGGRARPRACSRPAA